MSNYTITKIDKEKRHVSVVYDIDGLEQTMGDCPLDSIENMDAFLSEYGDRYEKSLAEADKNNVVADDIDKDVGEVKAIVSTAKPADQVADVSKEKL